MEISNNVRLLLLFVIINSQKIMLILLIYFSQSNITFSFISPLFLPFSFVKEILRMYTVNSTKRCNCTRNKQIFKLDDQKSSQFLRKNLWFHRRSKPVDHFELYMGQITCPIHFLVVISAKLNLQLRLRYRWKKSCGECATPFRQQVACVSWMNDSWANNVVDIE